MWVLFLTMIISSFSQDIKPIDPINFKPLQSPTFSYMMLDSSVWIFKGNTYGWTKLATNAQLVKYYVPYKDALKDVDLNTKNIKSSSQNLPVYIGVVTLPTLTKNGDGTVTVGGDGIITFNTLSDGTGNNVRLACLTGATLIPIDNSVSYLYCDYNNGNPIYAIASNPLLFLSDATHMPVVRVIRIDGTVLHFEEYNQYGTQLANKQLFKDVSLNGAQRWTGLTISTSATRISSVSAGSAWFGVQYYNMPINTAGSLGVLYEYYLVGGVWSKSIVTSYDASYYSDGNNRQTLLPNKWVAKYFFRDVGDDNEVYYIHGNSYTKDIDAYNEALPVHPIVVSAHSIYVGKIVIQEGSINGIAYPRVWNETITSQQAVNHYDLTAPSLVWSASNHTGDINTLASFNGSGTATTTAIGTLTENIDGLQWSDSTRQVIGGATVLQVKAGRVIPTSTNISHAESGYSGRIATFTTNYNSGASTFSGNTLNIPNYTLAGLGLGGSKITYGSVFTFSNDRDIVDKAYVDAIAAGNMPKTPVEVATTGNITLSGTQTIDTYAAVVGNRVLVWNQTTPSQNGIYVVAAGAWSRATDTDTWAELYKAYVAVINGSQSGSSFVCTIPSSGTLETTDVTWVIYGLPSNITAGTGLTKTGNEISLNTATSGALGGIKIGAGIIMNGDIASVSTNYAPPSGSANYVQVSPASPQSGNIDMTGIGTFGSGLSVLGADPSNVWLNLNNSVGNNYKLISGITGLTNYGFSIRNTTAGRDEFVVDNSGNVGIGTRTPSTLMDLTSNTTIKISLRDATTTLKQMYLGYDGINNYGLIQSIWDTNSYTPIILQPSGGNVGIGTITPQSALDVNGTYSKSGVNLFLDKLRTGYMGTSGQIPISNGISSDFTWTTPTTAHIASSTDKRYVTDAQLTVVGNTSGTNTGDNAVNTLYSGLVTNQTHTQDVTGATALTITNDVVTNAKLANVATSTIKGRVTAATGDPEDLTSTQVRTLLNVADGAEANVNADWNSVSGDSQILNKPSTFTPSAHTFDSHSNVTITANTVGEIPKWNGTAWINNTLTEAGIQAILNGGTGFVKSTAGTISYDNSIYLTAEVDGSTTNELNSSVGWDNSTNTVSVVDASGTKSAIITGFLESEVDGSITNEIQDLSLAGNTLSLSGDATPVDLSAYVNVAANLTYTASATDGKVNSDTGTDATMPAGSTTNASLMLPADKIKLDSDVDQAIANEGSMSVLSGTATTAIIHSNTAGSADIIIEVSTGLEITENEATDKITFTNNLTGLTDGSVTWERLSSTLTGKQTVTSTIDYNASGIGEITLTGNTTFSFTNLRLNKIFKLKLITGGFTPTFPSYCHTVVGSQVISGSGTFYLYFDCWNSTSGSEDVLLNVNKIQ